MSPEIVKMLEKNRDDNFEKRIEFAEMIGRLHALVSLALGDLQHVDELPSRNFDAAVNLLTQAQQMIEAKFDWRKDQ
jgi:hypothetical protein